METKEEILVDLMDRFVNDRGLWYAWKDHIKEQGYTLKELGFTDDEIQGHSI